MKNRYFTCSFEGFLAKFSTLSDYKTSNSTSINCYRDIHFLIVRIFTMP